MFWFGACIGNIAGPFFYKTAQAPSYHLGIGSLLVANIIEFCIFIVLRFSLRWENKRKERVRAELHASGLDTALNETAFRDITDKENPNFEYVY